MTASVINVEAIKDTRNAVLAPGITQPSPNQLKAIISLVVPFRESFVLAVVRVLRPILSGS